MAPKPPTPKWMADRHLLKESIGRVSGPHHLTHAGKKPKSLRDKVGTLKSMGPDTKIRDRRGPEWVKWLKSRDGLKKAVARRLNIPQGQGHYIYFQANEKGEIFARITKQQQSKQPFLLAHITDPKFIKAIKKLYPSSREHPR